METPCSFHLVNLFVLLMQGPAWNLHGISMEPPWKLHQNYIRVQDGTEELSKKGNMLRLLLLEITSNLHQKSMESPWNLHESDHWNQQGKSAKNLHQNSMEPTSILMKMTTKAFQKQCLKLLALFPSVTLKRKKI